MIYNHYRNRGAKKCGGGRGADRNHRLPFPADPEEHRSDIRITTNKIQTHYDIITTAASVYNAKLDCCAGTPAFIVGLSIQGRSLQQTLPCARNYLKQGIRIHLADICLVSEPAPCHFPAK